MHKPETEVETEDMDFPVIEVSPLLGAEQRTETDAVSETLCSLVSTHWTMDKVQEASSSEPSLSLNEPPYLKAVTVAVQQEETCLRHVFHADREIYSASCPRGTGAICPR
jgi:hypothetical protein